MRVLRNLGLAAVVLLVVGAAVLWTLGLGVLGSADSELNVPTGPERAPERVAASVARTEYRSLRHDGLCAFAAQASTSM